MVGAGALVTPLLGFPHWLGVLMVGVVVTLIVVTAGMISTTWVQFIKGSLLVLFCALLTVAILARGFDTIDADGNVKPTGSLGPIEFLDVFGKSTVTVQKQVGDEVRTERVQGEDLLVVGKHPLFKGVRAGGVSEKLDFISLMLALFAGTASLPHILIRYYTVKDAAAARKSTVVGIAAIGIFYVLTLYIGLGAMVGTVLPQDSNMVAPLLAKSFGQLPFAIISAIAFTTVLGTVSGLIMAASGAVAHDIMTNVMQRGMSDPEKVFAGKMVAIVVGAIAMVLGVLFKSMNVSFLVGWAFNVAASANLPSLVMLLFWRGTTKQGIYAAITVGLISSLGWLLLSGPAFRDLYGLPAQNAIAPFSQPGLVTIPLGFVVLIVVSLVTRKATP
jgi:cation/acetate symporter